MAWVGQLSKAFHGVQKLFFFKWWILFWFLKAKKWLFGDETNHIE